MMKMLKTVIIALALLTGAAHANNVEVVSGKPSGCPSRWCMCGVSLAVFGRIVPALNLAANWPLRFAHVAPAPGMVAARSGHGFLLKYHVAGRDWRVYDCNTYGRATGGAHKCIIHTRSIAGYTIVDPNSPASGGESRKRRGHGLPRQVLAKPAPSRYGADFSIH